MALTHGPLVPTPDEPKVTTNKDKLKAMVRYTDTLVGRLVSTLDDLKIRDRTIVIFTTDNGTSGGLRGTVGGDSMGDSHAQSDSLAGRKRPEAAWRVRHAANH